MKVSVPQEQIKRLFAVGKTNNFIATKLHLPRTVIKRVLEGKDVPYYTPKPRGTGKNICEHCHTRKKGEGMRFLCDYCFEHAGNQIYAECPVSR